MRAAVGGSTEVEFVLSPLDGSLQKIPIHQHIGVGFVVLSQGIGRGHLGHRGTVKQHGCCDRLLFEPGDADFRFGERIQHRREQLAAVAGSPQVSHIVSENFVERPQSIVSTPVNVHMSFLAHADLIANGRFQVIPELIFLARQAKGSCLTLDCNEKLRPW